jgi:hypothetical protein
MRILKGIMGDGDKINAKSFTDQITELNYFTSSYFLAEISAWKNSSLQHVNKSVGFVNVRYGTIGIAFVVCN